MIIPSVLHFLLYFTTFLGGGLLLAFLIVAALCWLGLDREEPEPNDDDREAIRRASVDTAFLLSHPRYNGNKIVRFEKRR